MAVPTITSATSSSEGADTTTATITMPATRPDDDLYILFFARDADNATFNSLSGWTDIQKLSNAVGSGSSHYVAWRIGAGTEPASYSYNHGDSEQSAHSVIRIPAGEFDPVTPINTSSGDADDAAGAPIAYSITPDRADCLVLASASWDSDDPDASGYAPTGWTDVDSVNSSVDTGDCGLYVISMDTPPAASSPTGNVTFAGSVSDEYASAMIAINPPSASSTPQAVTATAIGVAVFVHKAKKVVPATATATTGVTKNLTVTRAATASVTATALKKAKVTLAATTAATAVTSQLRVFSQALAATAVGAATLATSYFTTLVAAASTTATATMGKLARIARGITTGSAGLAKKAQVTHAATATGTAVALKSAAVIRAATALATGIVSTVQTSRVVLAATAIATATLTPLTVVRQALAVVTSALAALATVVTIFVVESGHLYRDMRIQLTRPLFRLLSSHKDPDAHNP